MAYKRLIVVAALAPLALAQQTLYGQCTRSVPGRRGIADKFKVVEKPGLVQLLVLPDQSVLTAQRYVTFSSSVNCGDLP